MGERGRTIAGLVGLWLLAMVAYLPTFGNYFSGEDFVFIGWLADGKVWYGAVQPQYYRPLPMAMWALDYAAFGLDPLPYHLTNIGLHALNTLLVALVARRLFSKMGAWLLAAVLFALHPLHPEAVTWIAGRPDLCMTAGWLVALLAFLHYRENQRGRWLLLSCAGYAAALFSKETAITLPLVAGIFIVVGRQQSRLESPAYTVGGASMRRHLPLFGSYALVTVVYVVARLMVLGGTASEGINLTIVARLVWNTTIGLGAAAFVPINTDLSSEAGWIAAALLALLIAVAVIVARKRELPRAPLVVGGLVALFGGLPGFGQPPLSLDLQQARLYYLPSVGICLLFALVLTVGLDAVPRLWRWGLPAAVVGIFAGGLLLNNTAWTAAGAVVRRTVEPLTSFGIAYQPGDPLIFADLPDNTHGAYIWRNGLTQAAPLFARQPVAVQRADSSTGASLPVSSRSRRTFAWRYDFPNDGGLHELFVLAQPGMFQTATIETNSRAWDFSRCGAVLDGWRLPDGAQCVVGEGLSIRATGGKAAQLVTPIQPQVAPGGWAYIELTLHATDPTGGQGRQSLALATVTNDLARRYPDWHGLIVLNDDQTRVHRVYFRPDENQAGLLVLNFPATLGTVTLQSVRLAWLP